MSIRRVVADCRTGLIVGQQKKTRMKKMNEQQAVERLKEIKDDIQRLRDEQDSIEKTLPDKVVYQNLDGTWTRFTKTDNIKEIQEGRMVWKSAGFSRYSTKTETLKNEPK